MHSFKKNKMGNYEKGQKGRNSLIRACHRNTGYSHLIVLNAHFAAEDHIQAQMQMPETDFKSAFSGQSIAKKVIFDRLAHQTDPNQGRSEPTNKLPFFFAFPTLTRKNVGDLDAL